jgi:hypothetical protein
MSLSNGHSSPPIRYRIQVDEAPRLTGFAPHQPVVASRFAWDQVVGSRFASDQMVANRSASDQPKKRAACRFVVRSKLEGRSWLVVRRPCAAADMHPCLLFERVSQQIDVLQESAGSEANTDAAVKYRRQIDRTTLLISRPCCDERKRSPSRSMR